MNSYECLQDATQFYQKYGVPPYKCTLLTQDIAIIAQTEHMKDKCEQDPGYSRVRAETDRSKVVSSGVVVDADDNSGQNQKSESSQQSSTHKVPANLAQTLHLGKS